MGLVLRAYDPRLRREVALKSLRPRALSFDAKARLVREAQAMAKLSHPNVVSVYDVELDGESVILVMELVVGSTLEAWQSENAGSPRDVVRAYVDAGRGLLAAHRAGLLHRDFKPSNVLVSADRVIKVTDFGIARVNPDATYFETSIGGGLVSDSGSHSFDDLSDLQTAPGIVMGTPVYMAPEQYTEQSLGPAVDQYAFCVALWRALTGEFFFGKVRSARALRRAKAAGPGPWPRSSQIPRRWAEAIRRGLHPDPAQRWPDLEDLLAVLSEQPTARRIRRVGAALGLAAAGLAAVGWSAAHNQARAERCSGASKRLASVWDSARGEEIESAFARVGKPSAVELATRTRQKLGAYAEDWANMYTEACEATVVRGEQSSEMMDLRMRCLHRALVDFDATVDELVDVDAEELHRVHRLLEGLRPLERCADVDGLGREVEPPLPDEAEVVETLRVKLADAKAQALAGHPADARITLNEVQAQLESVTYAPVRVETLLLHASVLDDLGQYAEAERTLGKAMELASINMDRDAMAESATSLMSIVGIRLGRLDEALRYEAFARGLARGNARREATLESSLGALRFQRGELAEAETAFRRALALREEVAQGESQAVSGARNNLATALEARGKFDEAEREHRRALAARIKSLGPEHPNVAESHHNLGILLFSKGALSAAEAELRRGLEVRLRTLGAKHPEVAVSRAGLAAVLDDRGALGEAEKELRLALSAFERTLGPQHPHVGMLHNNLGNLLNTQQKFRLAEHEYRQACAVYEASSPEDHPMLAMTRSNFAMFLLKQGRPGEALPLARQAWDVRQRDGTPAREQADTSFALAQALWETEPSPSARVQARALAERAEQAYAEAGELFVESRLEVRAWLEKHPTP